MDYESRAKAVLEAARSRGVRTPHRGFLPEAILVECIAGAIARAHDEGVDKASELCRTRVAVTNYGEASFAARTIRTLRVLEN